jgi:hypothetical protein
MKRLIAIAALAALAGCATAPEKIKAAEVSASKYAGRSCAELAGGYARIDTSLSSLSATQSEAHTNDVAGVILIGLPVGSMTSSNNDVREKEIARLKGEKNAIFAAQKQGGCVK